MCTVDFGNNIGVRNYMMKHVLYIIIFALLFLSHTAHAKTVSFYSAYLRAVQYDAQIKAAEAGHAAKKEEIGKARAKLRPSLQANAFQGRNATESSTLSGSSNEFFYDTKRYSVTAKQPVFNMVSIAGYGLAKAEVKKSEALLKKEQADLVLRTAEAYFNLLYAQDHLSFAKVRLHALKEQLEQAKRRYKAGFGTITEINEVQAEHDMALAEELESANRIDINRRKLENIIGLYPAVPYRLVPEAMHLGIPEPQNVEDWIAQALLKNIELDALHQDIAIASKELDKQRYAALPTIDLVAAKSYSESGNDYSIGSKYDTYSLNLQLNLPLYSGGYTSASVRQAKLYRIAAYEQLSFQEREVATAVREYYTGIEQSIARIHAYEQAVKSSEIALTGTKRGYAAGMRSNVDVLNAVENVYLNKKNLVQAQYQYILNHVYLKAATGVLKDADVKAVDAFLRLPDKE